MNQITILDFAGTLAPNSGADPEVVPPELNPSNDIASVLNDNTILVEEIGVEIDFTFSRQDEDDADDESHIANICQ
ncbi:MAG: hypothetical protein GY806_00350 [Gammaproteobacteria bacterium]|nr:hypothetical protein [Gammaproteobacteria bacterium]